MSKIPLEILFCENKLALIIVLYIFLIVSFTALKQAWLMSWGQGWLVLLTVCHPANPARDQSPEPKGETRT